MLVSVVIPAREWDSFLESTLESIAGQDLPTGVEVETVIGLCSVPPDRIPAGVRAVDNPTGAIPDGLNRAIGESSGAVVVRVDSRCVLQRDHIRRILEELTDDGRGCVGGAALVLDRGVFGSAYAVAFNSPLLGPSAYRYRATSGPVDTAYLGSWRREDLDELGGFDTRLRRNQDNELADRVRASGRTVWYDADLVVGYHNRRNLRTALAHHREFGMWRMIQAGHGQRGVGTRHITALGMTTTGVVGAAVAAALPSTRRALALTAVAGYLGAVAVGYRTASRLRRKRPDIAGPPLHPLGVALAPAVAALIDASWTAGLAQGMWLVRRGKADPAAESLGSTLR